jgi:hypothetical protein
MVTSSRTLLATIFIGFLMLFFDYCWSKGVKGLRTGKSHCLRFSFERILCGGLCGWVQPVKCLYNMFQVNANVWEKDLRLY